jgi:medium-chain acyl-[acyl-carrier-protein] hydrolase
MTQGVSLSPWIVCYSSNRLASFRLFCFPYAGGSASMFRRWSNEVPAHVEINAIQLPGRESRLDEPAVTSIQVIVESLASALEAYSGVPYAFFGHSMGALISFELTRLLRRNNTPGPRHLFVSACQAPQLPRPSPAIHRLPDGLLLDALRGLGGNLAGPQNPEMIHLLLPMIRADFSVYESYSYAPDDPLDCGISVYGGLQDEKVSRYDLEAWSYQSSIPVTVHMLPGNHFFISSSHSLLLQILRWELTKVTTGMT